MRWWYYGAAALHGSPHAVHAYHQADDSTSAKMFGSLVNALIFVMIVAIMTFVLVMLFKRGYTRCIYAYMGFAGFSIFFFLAGTIMLALLQHLRIHIDVISFAYMLFNFAVSSGSRRVGIVGIVVFWGGVLLRARGTGRSEISE